MNNNSIGIFYFSGSGNTKKIANLYSEKFKENNSKTELIELSNLVKNNLSINFDKYDLIGIGYPVHAFNAPSIVFDFIEKINNSQNKKAFIFKCSGGLLLRGGSTKQIRNKLKNKKINVFHEDLLVMPSNVVIKYSNEMSKQLYNAAIKKIDVSVRDIIENKEKLQKNPIWLNISSVLFSEFEKMGVRFGAQLFRVSNKCTHCLTCVKNCPTKNIYDKNGKIKFKWNCIFCLKCIYTCPVNAIYIPFINDFIIIKDWRKMHRAMTDKNVKENYLTEKTRGHFRNFYNYIKREN